ncbi:YceI family protein [Roseovarius carneus]|uniref:YceI family protein n=1 Tax=Roseovarius carneus TaxID=2853164 RepID=UPI001CCD90CB|nr:YceI family protein [Roseovarius carneus]
MRRLLALLALITWGSVVLAAPADYRLDVARSEVAFGFDLQGIAARGTMPVKAAKMSIDLRDVARSEVEVTLDAAAATAGVIFVTQTMKGPQVLDVGRYPEILFRSTRITGDLSGAVVEGDLTIRGITRPVRLNAGLFRQRGTDVNDLDRLTVQLTGAISRAAFGAGGFAGFVGDRIDLNIMARIEK